MSVMLRDKSAVYVSEPTHANISVEMKKEWAWAGHVMSWQDNRWLQTVTDWIPRERKRSGGSPKVGWADGIKESVTLARAKADEGDSPLPSLRMPK